MFYTRECLGFPYNKVVTKTLYLLVLDYDRFSRDDPIGEVCLPLGDLDLAAGLTMWKTLMPCKGSAVSRVHRQNAKLLLISFGLPFIGRHFTADKLIACYGCKY